MVTVCWNSRQYLPFDWYVRTGVIVPECPLSGLVHATGFPDGAVSSARCAASSANRLSRWSRRLPASPPTRAPPMTLAAIAVPPPPAAAAIRPPTAAPPSPPIAVRGPPPWPVSQPVNTQATSATTAIALNAFARQSHPSPIAIPPVRLV